jgi:hypothetical protein
MNWLRLQVKKLLMWLLITVLNKDEILVTVNGKTTFMEMTIPKLETYSGKMIGIFCCGLVDAVRSWLLAATDRNEEEAKKLLLEIYTAIQEIQNT